MHVVAKRRNFCPGAVACSSVASAPKAVLSCWLWLCAPLAPLTALSCWRRPLHVCVHTCRRQAVLHADHRCAPTQSMVQDAFIVTAAGTANKYFVYLLRLSCRTWPEPAQGLQTAFPGTLLKPLPFKRTKVFASWPFMSIRHGCRYARRAHEMPVQHA